MRDYSEHSREVRIEGFQKIQDSFPLPFVGRLSGFETDFVGRYILSQSWSGAGWMRSNAGINFNNPIDAQLYADQYVEAVCGCLSEGLLGIWSGEMGQQGAKLEEGLKKFGFDVDLDNPRCISAFSIHTYLYNYEDYYNFYNLIDGKKILIISSHEHSIRQQLTKNHLLFHRPIFQNNSFEIIKPPIQFAGNCDGRSWINHFDELKSQISSCDFDLAFVSCGGFGLLATKFIHDLGKGAIHVGGALQNFFGIFGKRYNNWSDHKSLHNEHWINVDPRDIPKGSETVEGGCYW